MKILDKIKEVAGKRAFAQRKEDQLLPILQHPDERLSAENLPIDFARDKQERIDLLQKLNTTLESQEWGARLGIAAPQVGINLRACIVAGIPMFNPTFTAPKQGAETKFIEGCYSLTRNSLWEVPRFKYGWVKWYDIDGNFHDEKFTGIKAIVAQHEISHLEGKCCNELGVCVKE